MTLGLAVPEQLTDPARKELAQRTARQLLAHDKVNKPLASQYQSVAARAAGQQAPRELKATAESRKETYE